MSTSRIRIGVVVPSLEQGGGIPSVAAFVCDTIERSGIFDLTIVSLATSRSDDLGVALSRPSSWFRGVSTSEGSWRGRRFTRIGASGSEFEFRRHQPRRALREALAHSDLIQVVSGSPAYANAVCNLGTPVAVHCATRAAVERQFANGTPPRAIDLWRRWMTGITDRMDRKALQSVDAIQVMNSWMGDYARQVNDGRRVIIRLVPPGVDSRRFRPVPDRTAQRDPYILCVGRLNDERKNIGLLLRAFAALPRALQATTRLCLAGSASPRPEFWRDVHALGLEDRVSFVPSPEPDALVSLYQSASVFALSSHEEGFGMVLLEAMACGVPVISTRSGGPDEIVRDGQDGYLVDVDDVEAFTDRLARLLSDTSQNVAMGTSARQRVLSTYDHTLAGDTLLSTYDALLHTAARPTRRRA